MKPPRLADLLLRVLLRDAAAREVIGGDLAEEFAERSERDARAARRWFWSQVVRSLGARTTAIGPVAPTTSRRSAGWTLDLRLAFRQWRRQPIFAATAIATLAIGVASTTTLFSLLDAVVLRPLPYSQPERLVIVGEANDDGEVDQTGYATYSDWRTRARSFSDLAIVRTWQPTLLGEDPEHLSGLRWSVNMLPMLGVAPALGRAFADQEDEPDRRRVVILSDALWRRRFGADPDVVGTVLQLDSGDFEVVGVMPPDFRILLPGYLGGVDLWAPLGYRPEDPWACRSCQHLRVFGRLAPDVSLEDARAELETIHQDLARSHPGEYSRAGESVAVAVTPVAAALIGPAGRALWLLLGAVALVLVIAAANVASLQLARQAVRAPELELRSALGADRRRIVRMLLTESGLLCMAAGTAGVVIAAAAIRTLRGLTAQPLPRLEDASLDARSLSFAFAVTLLGAAIVAATTLGAARAPGAGLGGGTRVARGHGAWTRRLLVAGNLALSVALLHGATLMTRSVAGLLSADTGFDATGVLSVQLSLLGPRYEEEAATTRAVDLLLEQVRALPGIQAAAATSQVPLGGDFDGRGIEVEGRAIVSADDLVSLQRYSVTPDYLATLRLGLASGRFVTSEDRRGSDPVVVLSESAAQRLFRGESALGRRIRTGGADTPWRTIVGVVRDVQHVDLRAEPLPSLYLPIEQFPDNFVTLVVRTSLPFERQAEALRATVARTLPDVPTYAVAPLAELELRAAGLERFTGKLLAVFAAIALLLAAIGLYGLVAYLVEARRREVGIRVALGAARSSVAWLVLRQGGALALAGFALGAIGAVALSRGLGGLLYDVGPGDPGSLLLVAGALLAVALTAQVGPLRRALRLDPARALRSE